MARRGCRGRAPAYSGVREAGNRNHGPRRRVHGRLGVRRLHGRAGAACRRNGDRWRPGRRRGSRRAVDRRARKPAPSRRKRPARRDGRTRLRLGRVRRADVALRRRRLRALRLPLSRRRPPRGPSERRSRRHGPGRLLPRARGPAHPIRAAGRTGSSAAPFDTSTRGGLPGARGEFRVGTKRKFPHPERARSAVSRARPELAEGGTEPPYSPTSAMARRKTSLSASARRSNSPKWFSPGTS